MIVAVTGKTAAAAEGKEPPKKGADGRFPLSLTGAAALLLFRNILSI